MRMKIEYLDDDSYWDWRDLDEPPYTIWFPVIFIKGD